VQYRLPVRRELDDSGKAVLDAGETYRHDLAAALQEIRNAIDEAPRWADGLIYPGLPGSKLFASESEVPIVGGAVRLAWSSAVLARPRRS
jgi:hypothetical protein